VKPSYVAMTTNITLTLLRAFKTVSEVQCSMTVAICYSKLQNSWNVLIKAVNHLQFLMWLLIYRCDSNT